MWVYETKKSDTPKMSEDKNEDDMEDEHISRKNTNDESENESDFDGDESKKPKKKTSSKKVKQKSIFVSLHFDSIKKQKMLQSQSRRNPSTGVSFSEKSNILRGCTKSSTKFSSTPQIIKLGTHR